MDDLDDEFDFDFVSNAAKKVQSNWAKNINREKSESERSVERDRAAEDQCDVGCKVNEKSEILAPCQTSPVKFGKENSLGKVVEKCDSPVSITPPGSPTGCTPLSNKAVRGANRTNKTRKALAQLKKVTAIGEGRRAVRENVRLGDEDLLSSEDEGGDGDLLSSEDNIVVKVMFKGKIERVTVGWMERMGGLTIESWLHFTNRRGDEPLGREETVGGLGLSVTDILQGRVRVAVEGEAPQGGIELKLQTKDRRSQPVLITIFPNEQMMVVLDKYVLKSGVNKEKVKFFFDGEELDEKQTAEELELEGGECIDVHIVA